MTRRAHLLHGAVFMLNQRHGVHLLDVGGQTLRRLEHAGALVADVRPEIRVLRHVPVQVPVAEAHPVALRTYPAPLLGEYAFLELGRVGLPVVLLQRLAHLE